MTAEELRVFLRAKKAYAEGKRVYIDPITHEAKYIEPGCDAATKLVECAICGVVTPRPKRVWKDGIHLGDMCEPCFRKRQER